MNGQSEKIRRYFNSKLESIRWQGNQGTAHCPLHEDNRPSLSVNAEKGVFYCHSCKVSGDLIEFERRISGCDVKTAAKRIAKLANRGGGSKVRSRIVAVYSYRDESGNRLYQQVRFDPKDFRFRRPDGAGGWIWNLKGVRRVLYRLPEVLRAKQVYVVEGEKDAETLRSLGLVATCNPGGAGKWGAEYSVFFRGKEIFILQDDDEPGQKHAQQVAASVVKYASKVKLLPPFPNAKDVTEWIEKGGKKKKLKSIVASARYFAPENKDVFTPAGDDGLAPADWRSRPLRGALVVRLVERFFLDYLVLPPHVPFVLALWVIGTYAFELFDSFGYLCVTSPTKRCGKTRLAEILELICAKALMGVNVSEAALFRSIAESKPTVIIDEAEALRNKNSDRAQYLLAILQAGYRQGAVVLRCVGKEFEVEKFPVYCPKVVLAIGNLPDTLRDRSVMVAMRRRMKDEEVSRFRRRVVAEIASGVRHAVQVWVAANKEKVGAAYVRQRLEFLQDREADIWEPLFAIGSVAAPERLQELKNVALRLAGEKSKLDVDDSQGIRLLADIRAIFQSGRIREMPTDQLVFKLKAIAESSWDELAPVKLARMLRPFGVSPRQLWINERNIRGYDREGFKTAFEAYLPPTSR